jgi:hypothetical protein
VGEAGGGEARRMMDAVSMFRHKKAGPQAPPFWLG